MSDRIDTDICVIGAGSAGLSLAAGASQMGARVVLVEGHKMGGDCLNYGCIPSKALIAAARHAQGMRSGRPFGITPVVPDIDYAAAMNHVRDVIATIAPVDSQDRFEGLGVHVIRAHGRFVSPTALEAGGHVITARRFVIATGSSPLVPPIKGLDSVPYLTNETLFDLRERPAHLLIIGGGPIGMEMAQAHRRLGCDVTVIEGETALGRDDPECAAIALDRLRGEGVRIIEGEQAAQIGGTAGAITLRTSAGTEVSGSHLLVAVGRKANIDRLDLDRAGVDHDRTITVGDDLRTSNRRIYAIGDVAGRLQFTHVAGYHAGVILRPILFGLPARARRHHIPWATFTDPELAQVGLTEARAREVHGNKASCVRFAFAENDRAVAERRTEGLIKVSVVRGKPVGATIVGPHAGDLLGVWALAIANGTKMSGIAGMVAPYPTWGEVNKRAAGAYFSPKLFDNPLVERTVRLVQRIIP
ncbi:dihydrolipoyl dehydrogenase family protein [Brevirhabdus sp.]|uniref:dihydrolipoyl dehydrogenase family protein n=1 Tax=Brevirhabdus sp. TaxID=2004514 RepID=UPI0040584C24